MIRRVVARRFKRWQEVEFNFPGHVVLAGPNNGGKTTALQAIAAWSLALRKWREKHDVRRYGKGATYTWQLLERAELSAVPLRHFDELWFDRVTSQPVELEVQTASWSLGMELRHDSAAQAWARPLKHSNHEAVIDGVLETLYIPPMTGLGATEEVMLPSVIDYRLGLGQPGTVIRNILYQASQTNGWSRIVACVQQLFHFTLHPPQVIGPYIVVQYSQNGRKVRYDVASAGSGFQQVLMLLAFLYGRPRGTVLLIDEPDAHLHVILQDAIYDVLRKAAAEQGSQLILATHSEVIIDSVEPRELCVVLGKPRLLADVAQRDRLVDALSVLSHTEVLKAEQTPGILYLEGHPDLECLRAFARVLKHPAERTLTVDLNWKPTVSDTRRGGAGIKAQDHFEALKLVRPDLKALELTDGDNHPGLGGTPITGQGYQRARWKRYEIESYLVHPDALARFIEQQVGPSNAPQAVAAMREWLTNNVGAGVLTNPHGDLPALVSTKARAFILPPALEAAGLFGIPYTRFHEIADLMEPNEVHPEVREMLDTIQKAFGLPTLGTP